MKHEAPLGLSLLHRDRNLMRFFALFSDSGLAISCGVPADCVVEDADKLTECNMRMIQASPLAKRASHSVEITIDTNSAWKKGFPIVEHLV